MNDTEFLNWVADRFVNVIGESPNVDFVQRLRDIAYQHDEHTKKTDGYGEIVVKRISEKTIVTIAPKYAKATLSLFAYASRTAGAFVGTDYISIGSITYYVTGWDNEEKVLLLERYDPPPTAPAPDHLRVDTTHPRGVRS